MMLPESFNPIILAMLVSLLISGFNKIVSFLLPGATIKGATILQFLSHIATTLSPLVCLCPL